MRRTFALLPTVRIDLLGYRHTVFTEGKDSVGRWAILLAFVLPLLLIPLMLGVGQEVLHWGEWASALLALVALGLYFLILFTLTPILSRTLALEVRPLNPSDTY